MLFSAPRERPAANKIMIFEFEHFFLQPMDSPMASANLEAAISFCTENPQWRLSIQSHKMIGIR